MIIVYTGEGKGKTSASVGQCVRALGQGLRVVFAQFMKREGRAGEQALLADLLGENFLAGGFGFYRREDEYPEHRKAAEALLSWLDGRMDKGLDMLVLDEALYALSAELVKKAELEQLLDRAQTERFHVVLSGRGAPDWLVERADIVTEMREVKHVYAAGGKATRGVEF